MTEFAWQYKKFFPFGSAPKTRGLPRSVRGKVAQIELLVTEATDMVEQV